MTISCNVNLADEEKTNERTREGGLSAPASPWIREDFARNWTAGDVLADFLAVPRLIADVGSGPGDFLAFFLAQFPEARGVWSDVSAAMRDIAEERLAPLGDRVEYVAADMSDIRPLPAGLDALVTSRALHHLDPEGLRAVYAEAAAHLAPGGWLINLDHVTIGRGWDARLRAARTELLPPRPEGTATAHHHDAPPPAIDDHLAGLREAGFTDIDIPWRGFHTCLFMARKADAAPLASM
jgi:SAM-dependent methyltransferase